ncbi:MAG: ATP-dependent Clp protease proteolytic subunit [Oscillospiraceae bacterium]
MALKLKVMQQAAAAGAHAFYLYDDIQGDSLDWWSGEKITSETSANFFRDELAKIPPDAPVELYINSLGGDVKEGLGIFTNLKRHAGAKTAYIDGFACSMASVVAMACDKVIMPRNTLMMVHNAWMYACGNPAELRKAADDLEKINEASNQSYLIHAGEKLTLETLKSLLDAETWLTAEQCIGYGLADEYAEQDADISAARQMLESTKQAAEQHSKASPAAAKVEQFAAAALAATQSKPPSRAAKQPHTPGRAGAEETRKKTAADAFAHLLHALINN